MKFIDLWFTLSPYMPLWINDGEDCTRYERKTHVPNEYDDKRVQYITIDGNGELTIEF